MQHPGGPGVCSCASTAYGFVQTECMHTGMPRWSICNIIDGHQSPPHSLTSYKPSCKTSVRDKFISENFYNRYLLGYSSFTHTHTHHLLYKMEITLTVERDKLGSWEEQGKEESRGSQLGLQKAFVNPIPNWSPLPWPQVFQDPSSDSSIGLPTWQLKPHSIANLRDINPSCPFTLTGIC